MQRYSHVWGINVGRIENKTVVLGVMVTYYEQGGEESNDVKTTGEEDEPGASGMARPPT